MANNSLNLTELDFNSYKTSLKTYLQSQSQFNDYDFDGPNITVLLDILAYNTYYNSFYLNMIGNEMFLDSAKLRDSIISHAKELNYTPRSFRSSKAVVDISIDTGTQDAVSVIIPKGTTFTSRIGSNGFSFSTDKNIIATGLGVLTANNTEIFEGVYVTETFSYSANNRFILNNPTIDTNSITLLVIEDSGSNTLTYTKASSLFGHQSNSQIFFLQAASNERYEVIFGDDVIGRRPKENAVILADYRVTNGELPNGAFRFNADGSIGGYANVSVETVTAASGGAISESNESIKYNAPRHFTTQERAITTEDYENLLRINFPEINAVSAYGGEDADPPQYGKVFVAVDLEDVDGIPESKKIEYYNFLRPRTALSIDPIFIDPDFLYLAVTTTVKYNINITSLNIGDVESIVLDSITNFNNTYLDDFKTSFRYSKFVEAIDDSASSIISNETEVLAMRKYTPLLNRVQNFDVQFNFPIQKDYPELSRSHKSSYISAVFSSPFVYNNNIVMLEDDGNGIIRIVSRSDETHSTVLNVGTVDYDSGIIFINNFKLDSYFGSGLKIYVRPRNKDITSSKNTILTISDEDISISVVQERE